MNKKEMWTAEEYFFLNRTCERIKRAGYVEFSGQLSECLSALEYQAKALSLYPSILNSNRLGGTERNLETLVTALSERYREEGVFVLPTKAVLGRSCEIGKVNLFYMLHHMGNTMREIFDFFDNRNPLSFVTDRMLSIMTEDVLLDLLGDSFLKDVKSIAAVELAEIWEGRMTSKSIVFNSELKNMWQIRQSVPPVFGTLLGTHEYISLCKQANGVCMIYITYSSEIPDEASALEEFLFGLNYEELNTIKYVLSQSNKKNITHHEVDQILGKKKGSYNCNTSGDPLELYRFFNHRRKQAVSRRHAGIRGPIRTFEENFMAFLLSGKAISKSNIMSNKT